MYYKPLKGRSLSESEINKLVNYYVTDWAKLKITHGLNHLDEIEPEICRDNIDNTSILKAYDLPSGLIYIVSLTFGKPYKKKDQIDKILEEFLINKHGEIETASNYDFA